MKTDDETLNALIDANIVWLNLKVDPNWRPAIRESLVAITGAINAVETFSLPDEAEPAPAFEP
jgi:hypothetical protein